MFTDFGPWTSPFFDQGHCQDTILVDLYSRSLFHSQLASTNCVLSSAWLWEVCVVMPVGCDSAHPHAYKVNHCCVLLLVSSYVATYSCVIKN